MIIECAHCEAKVDSKILGEHESHDTGPFPEKISLVECPVCKSPILACQELYEVRENEFEWGDAVRLWPEPSKHIHWGLPESVRHSLQEAEICCKAKAFSACAVMCGRALESICLEFKTKNKFLAGGLKELLDKQIIDEKIYKWGEALREHRNIGAHANNEKISKNDANDLLDFAIAICDYVFVLTDKFNNFMKRKMKAKEK